jgi:hypothetical protein
MEPKDIKVKPSGMIDKPRIVMLPDGPDHKNWIEVGKKEDKKGYKCVRVSYAPNFGHLWSSGYIDDANLVLAEKGEAYSWISSGIGGHGCP